MKMYPKLYQKGLCLLWLDIVIIAHLVIPSSAQREGKFLNHLFRSGFGDLPGFQNNVESLTMSPSTTRSEHSVDHLPRPTSPIRAGDSHNRNIPQLTATISTDDVYIGLAGLFDKQKNLYTSFETTTIAHQIKNKNENANVIGNDYLEIDMWKLKNDRFEDLERRIEDSGVKHFENKSINSINSLENYVFSNKTNIPIKSQEFNQKYWMRLKSIIGNMRSIFIQMYAPQNEMEDSVFGMFDKVIEFGDSVNVISRIFETFDHELIEFLGNKWYAVKDTFFNSSPFMKTVMSLDTNGMSHTMLKKIGHLLHDQANKLSSEDDFVIELMRQTGFMDDEIAQVFKLLEMKTDLLKDNNEVDAESRQYGGNSRINYNRNSIDRNGYDTYGSNDRYESPIEKSGGYGHSGGYQECHGYHCMMDSFDPFILLAGLAAAAFLAYIIYRLLSSTAKKRGVADMGLALDLSDLPEVMGDIYNWLEDTEDKYGYSQGSSDRLEESFGSLANSLWANFAADRTPEGCARRYLCDYVQDNTYRMLGAGATLNILALTALSQLFGDITSSKMIDHLHNNLLEGDDIACAINAPHCDDSTYHMALNTTIGVIH